MANQESDHSRLETPLRPHSESSAGGHGWGWSLRGLGTDTLTHLYTDTQQQHKHTSLTTVGIHRAHTCSDIFHSSIPSTLCGDSVFGSVANWAPTSKPPLLRKRIKDQTFVTGNIWPQESVSARWSPELTFLSAGPLSVSPCLLSPRLPH